MSRYIADGRVGSGGCIGDVEYILSVLVDYFGYLAELYISLIRPHIAVTLTD